MRTFTHLQRRMLIAFLVLVCTVLSACVGTGDARARAETAIDRFHRLFNSEEFATIYEDTDPAFKKVISEAQLADFLRSYRSRLGTFEDVPQPGHWGVNWSTSGTYVTITEDSVFRQGSARETFVWRIAGSGCTLVRYTMDNEQSARTSAPAA